MKKLEQEQGLRGEISKIVDGTGEGTQKGRENHAHINKDTQPSKFVKARFSCKAGLKIIFAEMRTS